MTPYEALQLALERAGSQGKLAEICGCSQTAVWKWLQSSKMLPGRYVLTVEKALGIPRHLLNPQFYPLEADALPASVDDETPVCGPILSARLLARHGNRAPVLDNQGAMA